MSNASFMQLTAMWSVSAALFNLETWSRSVPASLRLRSSSHFNSTCCSALPENQIRVILALVLRRKKKSTGADTYEGQELKLTHNSPPEQIIGIPGHFPGQIIEDHGRTLSVIAELLVLKEDLVSPLLPDAPLSSLQDGRLVKAFPLGTSSSVVSVILLVRVASFVAGSPFAFRVRVIFENVVVFRYTWKVVVGYKS